MDKKVLAILAGVAVVLLGLALWVYLPRGGPDLAGLAKVALISKKGGAKKENEESIEAVKRLAVLKEAKAMPHLRRIAAESQDPEVQIIAINGLVFSDDPESRLTLYEAMDHQAEAVRAAAYDALMNMGGGGLPEKLEYRPNDPEASRKKVTDRLRELLKDPSLRVPPK